MSVSAAVQKSLARILDQIEPEALSMVMEVLTDFSDWSTSFETTTKGYKVSPGVARGICR
jgi:hypothetical protein